MTQEQQEQIKREADFFVEFFLDKENDDIKQFLIEFFSDPIKPDKEMIDLVNNARVRRVEIDGVTESVSLEYYSTIKITVSGIDYHPENGGPTKILTPHMFYVLAV